MVAEPLNGFCASSPADFWSLFVAFYNLILPVVDR